MKEELIITIAGNSLIATLDMGGEFHEEVYDDIKSFDIESLIKALECETGLKATVIKETR